MSNFSINIFYHENRRQYKRLVDFFVKFNPPPSPPAPKLKNNVIFFTPRDYYYHPGISHGYGFEDRKYLNIWHVCRLHQLSTVLQYIQYTDTSGKTPNNAKGM